MTNEDVGPRILGPGFEQLLHGLTEGKVACILTEDELQMMFFAGAMAISGILKDKGLPDEKRRLLIAVAAKELDEYTAHIATMALMEKVGAHDRSN